MYNHTLQLIHVVSYQGKFLGYIPKTMHNNSYVYNYFYAKHTPTSFKFHILKLGAFKTGKTLLWSYQIRHILSY